MAISKFTPQRAKTDTGRTIGDNEVAKLANLNRLVDQVNAEFASLSPGGGGIPPLDVVTVGTLGTSPIIITYGSQATLSPAAGTQSAPVITFPNININGGSGTLSSILFPTLTLATISIQGFSSLTSISFPALTTVIGGMMGGGLAIGNNSSLTTVDISALTTLPANPYFGWYGCAFSQATVDHILVRMVATNATNGNLQINGGTSAAPSATGLAAKATLEGRGWSVTTN